MCTQRERKRDSLPVPRSFNFDGERVSRHERECRRVSLLTLSLVSSILEKKKKTAYNTQKRWPAPSKLPANPLEARPHGNNSPRKLHASLHPLPVAFESLTATDPALWRCVRFDTIRSPRSSSFANCPFNALCGKLPRTSRMICAFKALRSWLCR